MEYIYTSHAKFFTILQYLMMQKIFWFSVTITNLGCSRRYAGQYWCHTALCYSSSQHAGTNRGIYYFTFFHRSDDDIVIFWFVEYLTLRFIETTDLQQTGLLLIYLDAFRARTIFRKIALAAAFEQFLKFVAEEY